MLNRKFSIYSLNDNIISVFYYMIVGDDIATIYAKACS